MEDEYLFYISEEIRTNKVFVLIIYDIIDNKKRLKLSKLLQGYGFRIQKSAFEAIISKNKYEKILKELPDYVTEEDSIRVYKIIGKGQVRSFGIKSDTAQDDIILI